MNVRRIVGLAVATAVLSVPAAAPAWAEPDYPPIFNHISASTFVVARFGTVALKAQTFQPGSGVNYRVVAPSGLAASGTSTADGKGVVSQSIMFDRTGLNRVTFSGTAAEGGALELETAVTVTTAGNAGNGGSNNGGNGGTADNGGTTTATDTSGGGIPIINGALPRTGGEIVSTLLVAGVLFAGGGALIVAARRRREGSPSQKA